LKRTLTTLTAKTSLRKKKGMRRRRKKSKLLQLLTNRVQEIFSLPVWSLKLSRTQINLGDNQDLKTQEPVLLAAQPKNGGY
jgi:hypothetical protein